MSVNSCDELIDSAIDKLHSGDAPSAETLFRAALKISPDDPEATNLLGVALFNQQKAAEAAQTLERAVVLDPQSPDAHYNLAEVRVMQGQVEAAEKHYQICTRLDAAHPMGWRRLAQLLAGQEKHAQAATAAQSALNLNPDDVKLLIWVAQELMRAEKNKEAAELLKKAAPLHPGDLELQILQFNSAALVDDADAALGGIERALKISPKDPKILLARFALLHRLGRLTEAADAGSEYVRVFPDDADAHYTLGEIFEQQRELGGAALAFARYIEIKPEKAIGYARLGNILLHVGHLQNAEEQLNKALELDPTLVPAYMHLSHVQERTGRLEQAAETVRKALEVLPEDAEALSWLAMLLTKQGKHSQAAKTYLSALEKQPENVSALLGYGSLIAGQCKIEKAWDYFQKGMDLLPDDFGPYGSALFFCNAHPDLSKEEVFVLHQRWASLMRRHNPKVFDSWDNDVSRDRKLKIAYLSPDIRAHSVAYFLEPILSAHDKSKFEIILFDNTPTSDHISKHLHGMADGCFRIVGAGIDRVTELIREKKIDILVDLAGHTSENRLDVFATHPAPVQVSYLGYPNTTGLAEMNYRLTDAVVDPPGEDTYHSEQLIRLPGGFLCFNPPQPFEPVAPSPSGETGNITFASFNAPHKINRKVIQLWARVLKAVPGSTLLMKAGGLNDPETRRSILDGFEQNAIDQQRVVFVERTAGYHEHLQVYNRCDIALDTFPYNGTTTTCEALWMGLPVIALAGDRHSARVSKSILHQLQLSELVADDPDDFVRIAQELANDRPRLSALRASIRPTLVSSRLMDAKAHTAAIENAYQEMWNKWCDQAEA